MAQNDPFGPGDDDFDRFAREVGEGLKDMVGKFLAGQGGQAAWSRITDAAARPRRTEPAAQAARAKSSERYEAFITALGRRLAQGPKLRQEISEDVPESDA